MDVNIRRGKSCSDVREQARTGPRGRGREGAVGQVS